MARPRGMSTSRLTRREEEGGQINPRDSEGAIPQEDQGPGAGRLPNWELLYAITAEDKWIWPESEQGVNAKAGWQWC